MLAKRIIPCLDVKDGKVVKGINFEGLKEIGDPVALAKKYDKQGADELVFLDITATSSHRKTMVDVVESVARNIFIPYTVGGGIRTAEDIRNILLAGADKCSLNSAAVRDPLLISRSAALFGNQCIVLAVDGRMRKDRSGWNVVIDGGRTDTGIDALEWISDGAANGAGEILLTSMDADGTEKGYDIPFLKAVRARVHVPVVASGGCGSLNDFYKLFNENAADAALAASLFHYDTLTVAQVKQYLQEKGIPVRI